MEAGDARLVAEMTFSARVEGDLAYVDIKASPNASKTEIAGIQDGRVRIRVAAAPEDGKANAEIRAYLAKKLHCPKSAVAIVSGEKSRQKTVSLPAGCLASLQLLL